MKYLMSFNEAKQVGILYHYTTPEALLNILKTDELKTGEYGVNSFTRNKNYHLKNECVRRGPVRITVNGDAMSNHTKFFPWNSWVAKDKSRQKQKRYYDEWEERTYADIKGIKKFVTKIAIDPQQTRAWYIAHSIVGNWDAEKLIAAKSVGTKKYKNFLKEIKKYPIEIEFVADGVFYNCSKGAL